jgi:hypothetical protein
LAGDLEIGGPVNAKDPVGRALLFGAPGRFG